jgi:hypothetical protein
MTSKSKKGGTLERQELHASPMQPHPEDISANQALNHNEIRRRAYEIYLERGGLPGHELEDWLQAESELESAAVFTRDWDALPQRHTPNSGKGN